MSRVIVVIVSRCQKPGHAAFINARAFFRAAVLLAAAVFGGNILAQAQTLTTIYSFTGANGDREYPFAEGRLPCSL